MDRFTRWCSAVLVCLLVTSPGCIEPDREDYRDDAAEDFCNEAEACDNLGNGIIPDTHSDCVIEMRSEFNDMWPAEECGDGQINDEDYERCMSRALDYACEGGGLTLWDTLDRCSAENVCTD